MCFNWFGSSTTAERINFGSLAVIAPILEQMDLAAILDRHLPQDPQAEFSAGSILSLLVAARLSNPVALVNVADWAQQSGADLVWKIPPEKLNDDRLGRALDAFYYQRHSILASIALHVAETFDISLQRLHYDPTAIFFHGEYAVSQPRDDPATDLLRPWANDPPAHITHGHAAHDLKMIHAGVSVAIDERGAVPIFVQATDGNQNGHISVSEQFDLLLEYFRPQGLLMVSDRGTFSAGHAARCHREGVTVLCSVAWGNEYRALYNAHSSHLNWQLASYLSLEQQRRRNGTSSLPQEHYELAVLQHQLIDPDRGPKIPCRVIFVYSTADEKVCRDNRAQTVAKLRAGLEHLARSVAEGRRNTDPQAVARRVAKLFGQRRAARYFRWELLPLPAEEQAALPAAARGGRRPTHRFVFHYDAALAEADTCYDGLSILVTTAPRNQSADSLFSQFKQQNEVELAHHQWKTPLRVHPVFLKNPRRVEALVHVLLIALTAYYLIQRAYRLRVEPDASQAEQRTTTETILRVFANYTLDIEHQPAGRVVYTTRLSKRQREILHRLNFPTPAQLLARKLPHHPP
jgi:transposase